MGGYREANTFVYEGKLTLRTQYANGQWSGAGINSSNLFVASGGRWEIRAKFPISKGIGYAFQLFTDDVMLPEVNIAEGRVNGPLVTSGYHWSNGKQAMSTLSNTDMSGWHTYGVIMDETTITYTFDGAPWVTMTSAHVTTKTMWIGLRCDAMDPKGSAKDSETVDDGVPGPLTPEVSDIQIDWVAHYKKA